MRAFRLLPIVLLTLLAACTASLPANVARFQAMPAPSGQSFFIQASDPARNGSLEFRTYADLVRQRLAAQGYQPSVDAASSTLLVTLDYGVSNGRERVASRPGFGPSFGGGYGWGRGYYGGFPYANPYYAGRYRQPYFYGSFYDPFWGSAFDQPEVYSYTVYNSYVDMKIARTANKESVFEGRAEANTRSDDLTRLVPNLVTAMFTNFPGRSGERVRVNVPLDKAS